MNSFAELSQSQTQTLFMTPQLRQALKVLQCGASELEELTEKELIENPALERVEDAEAGPEAIASTELVNKTSDDLSQMEPLTEPFQNASGALKDESDFTERQVFEKPSLERHLLSQLLDLNISAQERRAAAFVIGNLNDDGYLDLSLDELGKIFSGSSQEFATALETVRSFEPAGIGAQSLKECLLLQLDRHGKRESLAAKIVEQHLELLAARKYQQIADTQCVSLQNVISALTIIRSLNPYPGRAASGCTAQTVAPDVSVRKIGGEYVVMLSGDGVPKLRISAYYRELVVRDRTSLDSASRTFIAAKLKGASWFLHCIFRREQTMRKIAAAIVKHERAFLDVGIEQLQSLRLRDVAAEIGVHESTVSRAVANKFIETPRGIFEFKYFFTPRLKNSASVLSTVSVRERVRVLIRDENPKGPLSDQALVELLKNEKITIARRTVTKYRENMGIDPSALRRRESQCVGMAEAV